MNPGDDLWPCPFCIVKSNTKIQCYIHLCRDHQDVTKNDKDFFPKFCTESNQESIVNCSDHPTAGKPIKKVREKLSRKCKNTNISSISKTEKSENDLTAFLRLVEEDYPQFNELAENFQSSQVDGTFFCNICPVKDRKPFLSERGLNIHKRKCHKDIENLNNIESLEGSEDNLREIFNLKSKIGVLKRIPKSARPLAAKLYIDLINKCIINNDFISWENLLPFSYKAFHISSKHKSKKRSLASIVKENLTQMNLPTNTKSKLTSADFYQRVESKVADFDVKGAVKLLCSEDSFAPTNLETINKLKEKHPSASRPLNESIMSLKILFQYQLGIMVLKRCLQ